MFHKIIMKTITMPFIHIISFFLILHISLFVDNQITTIKTIDYCSCCLEKNTI